MNDYKNMFAQALSVQAALGKAVTEVRLVKTPKGTVSGLFTTDETGAEALVTELTELNLLETATCYSTINKISDTYIDRYKLVYGLNKLIPYSTKTVKDDDISTLSLIMFDLDVKSKPANSSSTDDEKAAAKARLDGILKHLGDEGFPEPYYVTDSGNGYNFYYHIKFPNDTDHKILIKRFNNVIAGKFSDDVIDVDRVIVNPSRVAKLPGTMSVKGENTPERPHRQSCIITTNSDQPPLTEAQIQAYIDKYSQQEDTPKAVAAPIGTKKQSKKRRIIDVASYLDHYSISYRINQTILGGETATKYELECCPFNDHDNSYCSALIQFTDKSVVFKCFHNHCQQYDINDFIAKYPLPKEIPLLDGEKPTVLLYNTAVTKLEFLKNLTGDYFLKYNDTVYEFEKSSTNTLLNKLCVSEVGELIGGTGIATVKDTLRALFDDYARVVPVGRRIIRHEGALYYSFAPGKTMRIKDGKAEWYTGEDVYFLFDSDFIPQVEPDMSTPAEALPELVASTFNVSEQNMLRFLAQLCAFYIPDIITPALAFSGSHGVAKSTNAKKIVSLVDPSNVSVSSMPDKGDGLTGILSSNYLTVLDNVDKIPNKFSDILCIAVTGGYATKRKLYSDNTLFNSYLKCHLILTGVGTYISRPDLAERSNTVWLDAIPPEKRLSEKEVWEQFDELKPQLLGAILNAVSIGLTYVPEMTAKLTKLPRMADFTVHGAAFVKAMGCDEYKFLDEYMQKSAESVAVCATADSFNCMIINFVTGRGGRWSGKASELLTALKGDEPTSRGYSKILHKLTDSTLSRKLNQNSADLATAGLDVGKQSDDKKCIILI